MSSEKSFKQLEADLNLILDRIDQSSYDDLDLLVADYDKGMKLIIELQEKLKTAKNSIKKVKNRLN